MATKFDSTNINIYAGDDETVQLTVTQSGSAFDLSGYTIVMTAKSLDGNTQYFQVSAADGVNGSNYSGGIAVFAIPDTETVDLPRECLYDTQGTDGSGNITTFLRGKLIVTSEVTSG